MKHKIDAKDLLAWFERTQAYEIAKAFNECGETGLKSKAAIAAVRIIYHSQNGLAQRHWRTLVNMPIEDAQQ